MAHEGNTVDLSRDDSPPAKRQRTHQHTPKLMLRRLQGHAGWVEGAEGTIGADAPTPGSEQRRTSARIQKVAQQRELQQARDELDRANRTIGNLFKKVEGLDRDRSQLRAQLGTAMTDDRFRVLMQRSTTTARRLRALEKERDKQVPVPPPVAITTTAQHPRPRPPFPLPHAAEAGQRGHAACTPGATAGTPESAGCEATRHADRGRQGLGACPCLTAAGRPLARHPRALCCIQWPWSVLCLVGVGVSAGRPTRHRSTSRPPARPRPR